MENKCWTKKEWTIPFFIFFNFRIVLLTAFCSHWTTYHFLRWIPPPPAVWEFNFGHVFVFNVFRWKHRNVHATKPLGRDKVDFSWVDFVRLLGFYALEKIYNYKTNCHLLLNYFITSCNIINIILSLTCDRYVLCFSLLFKKFVYQSFI